VPELSQRPFEGKREGSEWDVRVATEYIVEEIAGWRVLYRLDGSWGAQPPAAVVYPSAPALRRGSGPAKRGRPLRVAEAWLWLAMALWAAFWIWLALG